MHLRGGTARAGNPYYVTFGLGGHLPATLFLNDVMPIETDWLVGIISTSWYQPELVGFLGDLDLQGESTAIVSLAVHAPLPPELTGARLTFCAFVFDSFSTGTGAATNPTDVMLR